MKNRTLSSLILGGVPALLFVTSSAAISAPLDGGDAPPVADPGGPYLNIECQGAQTTFQADGTGSFDPDGDPLTFEWRAECDCIVSFDDPFSATPMVTVEAGGKCDVTCFLVLKVTAGGESDKDNIRFQIVDTSAPVLDMSTAPDLVTKWTTGPDTQFDPAITGFPGVTDCDPNPTLVFSDVKIPGTQPGEPEVIVQRTWTATDVCGNQASDIQILTLLSPKAGAEASLDLAPAQCPNVFDPNSDGFAGVVHTERGFNAKRIMLGSVFIYRADGYGRVLHPNSQLKADVGSPATGSSPCGSEVLDGRTDYVMNFSSEALATELGLDELPSGVTVDLVVRGRLVTGERWIAQDSIQIQ